MKAIIILLLFTTSVNGQWNFILENNQIVWQKVYNSENDINYKKYIKENPLTTNLDLSRNKTSDFSNIFKLKDISNFKTILEGFSIKGGMVANVTIEFKKDKYRVTVSEIKTIDNYNNIGKITINNKNNFLSIERFMFQNNKLKTDAIHKEIMMALQHYFDNEFSLDYTNIVSDNW